MKNDLATIMRRHAAVLAILFLYGCTKEDLAGEKIEFRKRPEPVWKGTFTAADPSVIRDGDTLRMYYSSLLVSPKEKLVIAGVKSTDGINWIPADDVSGKESVALDISNDEWDDHLEAVAVLREGNETWMYYCGYPEEADVAGSIVAKGEIGFAKSINNRDFTRISTEPVLALGATNSSDANALFSPTIIKQGNTYYMMYVGYCVENCTPPFIGILAATSTDGKTWTKHSEPIISGTDFDLAWAQVIKEPAIVKGPDGIYYLFISGDKFIGVARSNNIIGPYEVYPDPILKIDYDWESTSVIAPTVLIEDNKVRMWYMGVEASGTGADFAIGYAESDFPFRWK